MTFGEAIAQDPDAPRKYEDAEALIADSERIECWPMTVEETRQIRVERLFAMITAAARGDYFLGVFPTEPYASRIAAIHEHIRFELERAHGRANAKPPSSPRPRGDLAAQMQLIDAEAWASAVRTARAGGENWGTNGPRA